MSTEGSVSKGVFVFKGKKKVANAENYLDTQNDESSAKLRQATCGEIWEAFNEKIQILQSDLNTRIFEDLIRYVGEAQTGFQLDKGQSLHILQEIPTAALVTGVNMPDHDVMFSNLASLLAERVSSHVAVLKSKDCPNIKSIMSNTLTQLMQHADLATDDDDEDLGSVNVRKISATMSALSSWYGQSCKKISSPRKRKSPGAALKTSTTKYPPVVIVFQDFEGFPAHVLQDFITICCNHLRRLPFVLIFGIATNVTAVHRLMPHAVSSLLSMEKFQAPPATEYLSQVIDQVIITPHMSFKLGPKVFSLLLDLFLYHDFSVINFVRAFQFSMLEHFYHNPISALCQNVEEAVKQLKHYNHDNLEQIRRLPSFRRYVEDSKPAEQIALLEMIFILRK